MRVEVRWHRIAEGKKEFMVASKAMQKAISSCDYAVSAFLLMSEALNRHSLNSTRYGVVFCFMSIREPTCNFPPIGTVSQSISFSLLRHDPNCIRRGRVTRTKSLHHDSAIYINLTMCPSPKNPIDFALKQWTRTRTSDRVTPPQPCPPSPSSSPPPSSP